MLQFRMSAFDTKKENKSENNECYFAWNNNKHTVCACALVSATKYIVNANGPNFECVSRQLKDIRIRFIHVQIKQLQQGAMAARVMKINYLRHRPFRQTRLTRCDAVKQGVNVWKMTMDYI